MTADELSNFVVNIYRGVLRRDASREEIEYWTWRLNTDLRPTRMVEEFLQSEEFRRQSPQTFVPAGHFYSPIVDPAEAGRHLTELELAGIPDHIPGVNLDRQQMVQTWMRLLPFVQTIPFRAAPGGSFRYGFVNPAYSWGDATILHAMLRLYRPQRIIEIGSGWSSVCIADTLKHFLDTACEVTFIEPAPQLLRELLGSECAGERLRILESRVQDVSLDLFDSLQTRDILFIDSTHVLKTGSDVCRELCEILPRLAPGVLVHFHDMFWPFEYPRKWVVEENRSWNELYAVRLMLTNTRTWKVLMFNHYMAQLERELIEKTHPDFLKNPGGALWIEKQEAST